MTENEKDSWLIRSATYLLAEGLALGLLAIQAAGVLLLSLIQEHLPVRAVLLLFGASTILWLVLAIAGVAAVRRQKREAEKWKRRAGLFSESEVMEKVRELAARAEHEHSQSSWFGYR